MLTFERTVVMSSITSNLNSLQDRAAQVRSFRVTASPSAAADALLNASPIVDLKTVANSGFQKQAVISADLEKIDQKIEESVQHLNSMLKENSTALNMSMDRVLGAPVVTVRDLQSGEVIRQIPNEVVVKLAHSIEAFKGWLHDGRA